MDEATSDGVPDQDITKVSDSTAPRPAAAVEAEDLPTEHIPALTRLPPISLPPLRPPMSPPAATVLPSPLPPAQMPTLPPKNPPMMDAARRFRPDSSRPSEYDALGARRAVAVGCVVAACAFATIALIFAFRPPPSLGTMPPIQAASVVLANAILSLGAGALGYGLLRMAERLSAPSSASSSTDSRF
jgi:hypothetical protein